MPSSAAWPLYNYRYVCVNSLVKWPRGSSVGHSNIMAGVSVKMLPVVSGGLSKPCHVPADLHVCVDDRMFVRLPKYAATTWRILGLQSRVAAPRNRSCILDQLITARNAKLHQHIFENDHAPELDSPDVSSSFINDNDGRKHRKQKRNKRDTVPAVITIIAPIIDGVGGFNMQVLAPDKVTSPLAMELTANNVDYLQKVPMIVGGDAHTPPRKRVHRDRSQIATKGVVRDLGKHRVLCRVQEGRGRMRRMRTKVFNFDKFPTQRDAEARAEEFMIAHTPTLIDLESPQPQIES